MGSFPDVRIPYIFRLLNKEVNFRESPLFICSKVTKVEFNSRFVIREALAYTKGWVKASPKTLSDHCIVSQGRDFVFLKTQMNLTLHVGNKSSPSLHKIGCLGGKSSSYTYETNSIDETTDQFKKEKKMKENMNFLCQQKHDQIFYYLTE